MAALIVDSQTSDHLQVALINKLLEAKGSDNFFSTMKEEKMDFGNCPECDHSNFWLIPETELNTLGWVTHEQDPRVPKTTDAKICQTHEQACIKKKTTI